MVGFSHTTPPNGTATKGGQHCRVTILGRRFPAHKKCSAPDEGAEHFCVRLSGRYNALYLAAPLGLARCAPGTPRAPKSREKRIGSGHKSLWSLPICNEHYIIPKCSNAARIAASFSGGHLGCWEAPDLGGL